MDKRQTQTREIRLQIYCSECWVLEVANILVVGGDASFVGRLVNPLLKPDSARNSRTVLGTGDHERICRETVLIL